MSCFSSECYSLGISTQKGKGPLELATFWIMMHHHSQRQSSSSVVSHLLLRIFMSSWNLAIRKLYKYAKTCYICLFHSYPSLWYNFWGLVLRQRSQTPIQVLMVEMMMTA